MIRAGRGGVYAADWLKRCIIGISWDFGGANIAATDRNDLITAYAAAHPSENKLIAAVNVGQANRFARRLTNARLRQLRTYQVHELLLAVHIELRVNVLGVAADGVLCQVQRFCDVGLRAALAQHLHHLKLARR